MTDIIMKLNTHWGEGSVKPGSGITEQELKHFDDQWCVLLPADLKDYFRFANGTSGEYDADLFQFNSISNFLPAHIYFKDWIGGVPDYSKWATAGVASDYFILANYQFHLFSYGVRISRDPSITNTVKIFCGASSKEIANSFSEFADLYLQQSELLFF